MQLRFAVPADLRLRLGNWGNGDTITALRLSTRREWALTKDLAAILTLFMGGRYLDDGISAAAEILAISKRRAKQGIDALLRESLLEKEGVADTPCPSNRRIWADHGWHAAYDHHLATWDYPFVDYDVDGWQEDRRRMKLYRKQRPDTGAWKHERCENLTRIVSMPEGTAALESLDHWSRSREPLTRHRLTTILSTSFSPLPPHAGTNKPRRSSPSGGARHPCEGYAFNLSVPGLDRGVWHVRSAGSDLAWITELPSDDWLRRHASGLFLRGQPPQALIIITAVFDRNMYRYREPRTLRTNFMDAGHIIGTIELTAQSLGIEAFANCGLDDAGIEQLLGLNGLAEGAIAGVALSGAE